MEGDKKWWFDLINHKTINISEIEIISLMKEKPLNFFTEKAKDNSSSIFAQMLYTDYVDFLIAFYETYKTELNGDIDVFISSKKAVSLRNLIIENLSVSLNKDFNKNDKDKRKRLLQQYFNDPSIILENGKIPGVSFLKSKEEDIKEKIKASFDYNLDYLRLIFFDKIVNDENYEINFINFIEASVHSEESFKSGIDFYNGKNIELLNLTERKNHKSFNEKKYIEFFQKNALILSYAINNINISKFILSHINNKDKYLNILYKLRDRQKDFNKKISYLTNQKLPVPASIVAGKTDFLELMIDFGYQLSSEEVNLIREKELHKKIKNFKDDFIEKYIKKLTDKNEEDKAKYLFKDFNSLNKEDFEILLNSLDFKKIDNNSLPVMHYKVNLNQVIELFLNNEASLVDVLIVLDNKEFLKKYGFKKLNLLQKEHLKISYIDFIRNTGTDQSNLISLINEIKEDINPHIISDLYKAFLKVKKNNINISLDYILSNIITKDELLANKDYILCQSINMNRKFIEDGNDITINQKRYLVNLLAKEIEQNTQTKNEELKNKTIKIIADNILAINKVIPEILNNLKSELNKSGIENITLDTLIEKGMILNSLNYQDDVLLPSKRRL